MKTKLRYPSLRRVRREPNLNGGGGNSPKFSDGFYVLAREFHHGYGKSMRFLCSAWDYLDEAIESRDRFAEAYPRHRVSVRHLSASATRPWDGVTLSLS